MELDNLKDRRLEMVQKCEKENEVLNPPVLRAMREVPRHSFVDDYFRYMAYMDKSLPLPHGQMMEPPSLVGSILQAAKLSPSDRVLEIGTGSGYQTALLSGLVKEIYSVEIVGDILNAAKGRLKRYDLENVFLSNHNGAKGWTNHAPYDVILVSSRLDEIPKSLFHQLKKGGRLVAPLGTKIDQHLVRFTKKGDQILKEILMPVNLFPLLTEDVSERKGLYRFPAKEKAKLGIY